MNLIIKNFMLMGFLIFLPYPLDARSTKKPSCYCSDLSAEMDNGTHVGYCLSKDHTNRDHSKNT